MFFIFFPPVLLRVGPHHSVCSSHESFPSMAIPCCSRSSTLSTSLLALSLRLTFGLLLLLLPASSAFLLSLSISLHSCSACVLLVAVCSTLLLSSGVSSFRSLSSHNPPPIFLLSSRVTFTYSPNPAFLCYLDLLCSTR